MSGEGAPNQVISSYIDYEEEARKLVKITIMRSVHNLLKTEAADTETGSETGSEQPVPTEWPTGENFTVEKGGKSIDELVKVSYTLPLV